MRLFYDEGTRPRALLIKRALLSPPFIERNFLLSFTTTRCGNGLHLYLSHQCCAQRDGGMS